MCNKKIIEFSNERHFWETYFHTLSDNDNDNDDDSDNDDDGMLFLFERAKHTNPLTQQ